MRSDSITQMPVCRQVLRSVVAFVLVFLLSFSPAHASLMPSEWVLFSSVNTSGPDGHQNGVLFDQAQAEFHTSHLAEIPPTTASTSYDISIGSTFATYDIRPDHDCINSMGERPRCASRGLITISPSHDAMITFDIDYQYSLSGNLTLAAAAASITDLTSQSQPYSFFGRTRVAIFELNPSGTLAVHESVLLPGGQTYRIGYLMQVDAQSNMPSQTPSTGDGIARITMTIPEPSTASLAAFFAILFFTRRYPVRSA